MKFKKISYSKLNFEILIIVFLFLYMGFIYFSIALSNIFLGIAVFIFLLGWILKKIDLNFNKKNFLVFFLLIIPFLMTLLSVLHSEEFLNGLSSIRLRIPILVISFIIIFLKLKNNHFINGLRLYFILTLISTILTLFKAFSFIGEGIIFHPEYTFFITPIQHPYFGIYLIIAIISLFEYKLITNKHLKITTILILVLGIIISTSRIAYLLLFFMIIYYSFQIITSKKAILFGIVFAVSLMVFVVSNQKILAKFQTSFSYQNSPRLKLWNNAIKVIHQSDQKIFGIGIGDYYLNKKDPYYFRETSNGSYGYDPHSQLLDFFISNGYLGLLLLTGYFLIQVIWISNKNRFAVFVFITISLFALTESILNRQYGVQLYSIFLPLIFKENFKKLI